MRSIIITSFALLLATTAAPALAQYGGSPDQQIDGVPRMGQAQTQAPAAGKDEAVAPDQVAPDDQMAPDDQAAPDEAGKGDGEDEAEAGPPPDPKLDEGSPPPDAGAPAQTWQGEDGTNYCRRSDGTVGTVAGAGAGALIGHGIDRHGERGTGTILGAIAGALIGRAVEQSSTRCS